MPLDENLLKRRDLDALRMVERAFTSGPLADVLDGAPLLERRRNVTAKQFEREYRGRRPVILEGYAADWPSVRTWSFGHLAERCGDVPVTVNSYVSDEARRVPFREFVSMLEQPADDSSLACYLQEWYYQASYPDLAEDMPELEIAQYDFRRNLYGEEASVNHQLWMGQKGGITGLHQDSYSIDVMHVQIVGEKLWYIMGPKADLRLDECGQPDLGAFCKSSDTQLMRFVLNPGDVLYLPAWWYHRIELLSDSIGLGRKCLDEANLHAHIRQRVGELLALALNADELRRTHSELFDVVMTRAGILARQMNIDLSRLRQ